ncbi:MAG TPA: peptide chain release factor 2 [Aquifex sp.]|nr:peptide chain release factor 2 [Aquifex sp.]
MKYELEQLLEDLKKRFEDIKQTLDVEKLEEELRKLDEEMSASDFWNDQKRAKEVLQRRKYIEETLKGFRDIESSLEGVEEMLEETDETDMENLALLEEELKSIEDKIGKLEIKTYLSGEMDAKNAFLTIQAGAGGTEACDWAQMLMRMYTRWAEKKGYTVEVVDITPDDVAGIKSATLHIKGPYAYGYLRGESGVHRLVRISPFDANKRRHTSFASVQVAPEIDEDIEVEIRPEDLKIETFRSSGAGGQYVNTTDTAVRITHIPTGIVVQCQDERSQFQNKQKALKILKAKLYQLELQKLEEKRKQYEGEKTDIGWGHQIRSYVFTPYQLVKDLRTGYEDTQIDRVMDGEIDGFIESYLKWWANRQKQKEEKAS